jgi:hypothetical protein
LSWPVFDQRGILNIFGTRSIDVKKNGLIIERWSIKEDVCMCESSDISVNFNNQHKLTWRKLMRESLVDRQDISQPEDDNLKIKMFGLKG